MLQCVRDQTTGAAKSAATVWPQARGGQYWRSGTAGRGEYRRVVATAAHPDFGYAQKDINQLFFNDAALMLLDQPATQPWAPLPAPVRERRWLDASMQGLLRAG